jgi:hypothetical protein
MEELFHGTKERAFASHLEHEKLAFLAAQHACMHGLFGPAAYSHLLTHAIGMCLSERKRYVYNTTGQ